MYGSSTGGNDSLTSTGSNNQLWGDAERMSGSSVGGADTFVFGSENGTATIMDFRRTEGISGTERDQIDLTAALVSGGGALSWGDLDTDGIGGMLDDGDAFVTIVGGDTLIDLGLAAGGPADVNVLTVAGVTDLEESDFIFS
jgi:hypothetical protein